jgi:cytochrome bd ubiquinol oxidase subunit I
MSAEIIHRLHFAFTVTFHYLFPQLTMGLGLLIVVIKTVALRTGDATWDRSARFWGRIFAINFVFGVVTGIPMEFEFGTNWARFSRLSGGVIGQPLAMEGVFSFFLESAHLAPHALVFRSHGLARLLDLGLLHHRHRRLDAASRGLLATARRAL